MSKKVLNKLDLEVKSNEIHKKSMKVIDFINDAKKTLFSFEIIPPLKGKSIEQIYAGIDPLLEFEPAFIDVTYHREEYIYKERKNGLLEKVTVKKRPGTVGICAAIMNKYQIEAVPHLICGGFTKEETEAALIDLNFLGIHNVLVLRGDPVKSEPVFIPEPGGHAYAIDLVKQVIDMNKGQFLDEDLKNAVPTNFCAGVAGYPDKHYEAPNLKQDIINLKQKVDAGAEYIVTQMFFDNQKFFDFVKLCREAGINVPIIPGIKPLTRKAHIRSLPRIFQIEIPDVLVEIIDNCKDDDEALEAGIDFCIQQTKELISFGVPCVHYYTMGRSEAIRKVAKAAF